MFRVTFSLLDDLGVNTTKTFFTAAADLTELQADVDDMVIALGNLTQSSVWKATATIALSITPSSLTVGSNNDEGITVTVDVAGVQDNAPLKVPAPIAALKVSGSRAVDQSNAAFIAFIDEFQAPNRWRANSNNPGEVVSVIRATFDKN